MTHRTVSEYAVDDLWVLARRQLAITDIEPSVSRREVDQLMKLLGRRHPSQSLRSWLSQSRQEAMASAQCAQIIPFDPRRQVFRPLTEFVRLAADDAGAEIPLFGGPLEDQNGCFRLQIEKDGDYLLVSLSALGHACDEVGGRLVGIASSASGSHPIALLELDEDGDSTVRLPDSKLLREALLRPAIGVIEAR